MMSYKVNNVQSISIVDARVDFWPDGEYVEETPRGELALSVRFDDGASYRCDVPIDAMNFKKEVVECANDAIEQRKELLMKDMMKLADKYSAEDRIDLAKRILSDSEGYVVYRQSRPV